MAKHNDNVFREVVTRGLKQQHTQGIAQGAYAMCKVILDKATVEDKTADERLADIVQFCSVCIAQKEKKENPNAND